MTVDPESPEKVVDIFVEMDKEGSSLGGWVRAWAVLVSTAIHHGVPLRRIVDQFRGWEFGAGGITNDPNIPIAKSIPDYLSRLLERYCDG